MMNRTEFEKSLEEAVHFWGMRSAVEVAGLIGEEAAKMVGYDQRNPHHCYDLYQHTLHTVEYVRLWKDCLKENADMQKNLNEIRIAAFFHDIGKTKVAKEKNGHLVFYGHAMKSSEIAEKLLEKMGYSEQERRRICFYIRHHDDFIQYEIPSGKENVKGPQITSDAIFKHIRKQNEKYPCFTGEERKMIWENLLSLCRADAMAQAEFVYMGGTLINTRKKKIKKTELIYKLIAG